MAAACCRRGSLQRACRRRLNAGYHAAYLEGTKEKPMKAWLKLIPIALVATVTGLPSIEVAVADAPAPVAAVEPFCDYCKDYTDAAAAAGAQPSAYRPGAGYAEVMINVAASARVPSNADAWVARMRPRSEAR